MNLPGIWELRRFHVFLLTLVVRPLLLPLYLYLIFFGSIQFAWLKLARVENIAQAFSEVMLRAVLVAPFMALVMLFGRVDM